MKKISRKISLIRLESKSQIDSRFAGPAINCPASNWTALMKKKAELLQFFNMRSDR
jgi:hypothetical protein